MTGVLEIVSRLEEAGGALELAGSRIRYRVPSGNSEIRDFIAELRRRRSEVIAFLRTRNAKPQMPAGVHLLEWNLKKPPVAIETCAIVTDTALFAHTTLEQLRTALTQPKRWVGWSVPQLIERLAQVGVTVALEPSDKLSEAHP